MWLRAVTRVSAPLAEVFPFFADAANLQALTPPWLHFTIATPPPITIKEGTLIEYRLRLHGLPLRWVSEIPVFNPPHAFVDEQRAGPYRRWIHLHRFDADGDGTVVRDDVQFELPGGKAAAALVARDLARIFTFRHQALLERFEEPHPRPPARVEIL